MLHVVRLSQPEGLSEAEFTDLRRGIQAEPDQVILMKFLDLSVRMSAATSVRSCTQTIKCILC